MCKCPRERTVQRADGTARVPPCVRLQRCVSACVCARALCVCVRCMCVYVCARALCACVRVRACARTSASHVQVVGSSTDLSLGGRQRKALPHVRACHSGGGRRQNGRDFPGSPIQPAHTQDANTGGKHTHTNTLEPHTQTRVRTRAQHRRAHYSHTHARVRPPPRARMSERDQQSK